MGGAAPTRWLAIAWVIGALDSHAALATDRVSVGGYVEGYRVVEVDRATQRQRPSAVVDLNLRGELVPSLQFFVDTRSMIGGTPEHADGFGVFNLGDSFQNISPSLEIEEGWLDWRLDEADVRLGKQKFAWGRLDLFRPTDVLNPRRFNDPFVVEDEEAKIGIPAVDVTYYLPTVALADTSVALVWVPLPVAFRFPLQDERWFPDSANVPESVVIPADFFGLGSGSTIVPTLHTENAPPPQQLDEGAVAVRVNGKTSRVDWSLMYYSGLETAPAFRFSTEVRSPSAQAKIAAGERPTIPGGDLKNLLADATLQPHSERIHVVGGDCASTFGGFTARFEAAYGFGRWIPRSTESLLSLDNIQSSVGPVIFEVVDTILRGQTAAIDLGDLFVKRDRFEWGFGIDYMIDGWLPLLQVNQSLLPDNDASDLLVEDTDTRVLVALRKLFLDDRLKLDLVGFQGLERSYTTGIARFTFDFTDNVRARFGYLMIAGTRRSVIGQYQDLDEAFFQMRYSF